MLPVLIQSFDLRKITDFMLQGMLGSISIVEDKRSHCFKRVRVCKGMERDKKKKREKIRVKKKYLKTGSKKGKERARVGNEHFR